MGLDRSGPEGNLLKTLRLLGQLSETRLFVQVNNFPEILVTESW
jgi:hypothetical protein